LRRRIKAALVTGYCRGFVPAEVVSFGFQIFRLQGA
jgi:hypothetical protein